MEPQMGLASAIGQQTQPMRDVDQIVMMLKQGVNPETLVQEGIPVELVQAAMEIVQKEATQVPTEETGLAQQLFERP